MRSKEVFFGTDTNRFETSRGIADTSKGSRAFDPDLRDVDRLLAQAHNQNEILVTALHEAREQIAALKEGRIDAGFGRIRFDDPAVEQLLLRTEKMIAALPSGHPLLARGGPLRLNDVAREILIVYPSAPRPSYADQVLALYRERELQPPAVHEVREMQTALGLVAAESGICLVPASVERFRRDNVEYRPLDEEKAISPIIMSSRKGDRSPEVALILKLIREMYRKDGITFGE